jgi:hypothetical protein
MNFEHNSIGILNAHTQLRLASKVRDWRIGNIDIRRANPFTLEDFY